jgi:hypothetical protein
MAAWEDASFSCGAGVLPQATRPSDAIPQPTSPTASFIPFMILAPLFESLLSRRRAGFSIDLLIGRPSDAASFDGTLEQRACQREHDGEGN